MKSNFSYFNFLHYRFIADEDEQGGDATIISGWFTNMPTKLVIGY